ncbi:MAG: replication factor C large subunit [Nanoarchaeota archaeon]|nr:replication factor C large subunit [Nanoarchaeota archaeon]
MVFSEKYRPKKVSEVSGQSAAMQSILKIITHNSKRPGAILIHGPIGCGKNSAISAIAREMNFEVIELNASDLRGKDQMRKTVRGAVLQRSLFNKKKMIVIDEIDSVSGREKNGLIELAYLIDQSPYPIFLIANDPYSKNIASLRKKYPLVGFKKLESPDLMNILKKICVNENIPFLESSLKKLALLSGGDARAAINDLQAMGKGIDGEIAVSKRDQEVGIFNALRTIFRSNSFAVTGALNNVDMPAYETMMWIDENIPVEFDVREMESAYHYLSKADIFYKRISRHNNWHFATYSNIFITAGICFSKRRVHEGFVSYRRITRLLKMWQSNKSLKEETAGKFGSAMHCSRRKIFREMPYLKQIYGNMSDGHREALSEELSLNSGEENFLLEQK